MTANIWNPQPNTVTQVNANGLIKQEVVDSVADQRVFTIESFAYAVGTGSLKVYRNGKVLARNVGFVELNQTQFILADPAEDGDEILAEAVVSITGSAVVDAQLRSDLAANNGSNIVMFLQQGVGAVVRSVLDKFLENLSIRDFGVVGNGTDETLKIQRAFAAAITYTNHIKIPMPQTKYVVTAPIDLRGLNGFVVDTQGLPVFEKSTFDAPIFLIGGERNYIGDMKLQFSRRPTALETDAVAIRVHNFYEGIIGRMYYYNVYRAMDQYQGLVNGGQNAFYSNTIGDIRCVSFTDYAIKMIPFSGGNSGNKWGNVYINNRNGAAANQSLACNGGFWLQTAQNDSIELLNLEWMANAGAALVLNQAGNPHIKALHLEGLYPTTAFNPIIDIPGGDGSAPVFDCITVTGCDFTAVAGQGLFRLDNQGTRLEVRGGLSIGNTGAANMKFLVNGGATCYGSYVNVHSFNDKDNCFSADAYSPKVTLGAVTAGVEYPIQRWNQNFATHSAAVQDNAGGLQSNAMMFGTPDSVYADMMSLWDSVNKQFNIKQPGMYECFFNAPTSAGAVIQVKKNGSNVGNLIPANNGNDSLRIYANRGEYIQFYCASGNYTRTAAYFGVSRK
jgi:hypothetical protein